MTLLDEWHVVVDVDGTVPDDVAAALTAELFASLVQWAAAAALRVSRPDVGVQISVFR